MRATVTLDPWGSGDLPLLERLMGEPRRTEHLGGPENPDKLRERQGRYERLEGDDRSVQDRRRGKRRRRRLGRLLDEGVARPAGL